MKNPSRRFWLTFLLGGGLVGLLFFGLFAHAANYRERVLPGAQVGTIPVGGLDRNELTSFLQAVGDRLVSHGLRFSYQAEGGQKNFFLSPVIVTESAAIELMTIDVERSVAELIAYGKDGDVWQRAVQALQSRWTRPRLALTNIMIDAERIRRELQAELGKYETPVRHATVRVTALEPLAYERVSAAPGRVFDYEQAISALRAAWSRLEPAAITVTERPVAPHILDAEVEAILPRLPAVLAPGGLVLSYKDSITRQTREWTITPSRLADWLTVQRLDEAPAFGLDESAVRQYLETTVSPAVAVEARDAKFVIDKETGKVTEFQGSRPGREADLAAAYKALNDIILQRARHDEGPPAGGASPASPPMGEAGAVSLAVTSIEPKLTTGAVNNLGISEVLGIGHSNFSGSPGNRIKNIRHAARKLNGVLIKPGEEFSAIKYTEPFTEEDGYLPELVIKGNELKPEIGGGLCQIGTTLFRMAMNSALPITERRNHSLVVSYYNDLENGLPGTDATMYEPAPDFRFKNDTGQAVLIQTEADEKTGDLFFTLWGASDGRKGWFDAPAVKRWIEPGDTQIVPTPKLAVGEKKCQKSFRGAEAGFTYHRLLPDGTPEDRVFSSYYRPLPEICLIGVKEEDLDSICDPHEPCYQEKKSHEIDVNQVADVPIVVE